MRLLVSAEQDTTWSSILGGQPAEPGCTPKVNLDRAVANARDASACRGLSSWNANRWSRLLLIGTSAIAVVYGKPSHVSNHKSHPELSADVNQTWKRIDAPRTQSPSDYPIIALPKAHNCV